MSQETARQATGGQFVHLHNHSHFSLLDGLQKIPIMLDRVAELGMEAVALTDHGTLSGAVEFYKEAKKRDLKPILGVEAYVAPRAHTDKSGRQDMNPFHLILLAYNNAGYHNLMKLVTIANLDGFYVKPRVDRALLEQYHEGLIALSACAGGEVATHILEGNLPEAENVAHWYDQTFGRGNYFLELQAHEEQWEPQKRINAAKIELSKKTGIPLVVTADSHYTLHENHDAHETLLCVQTGKTLDDAGRMTMEMDLYLNGAGEILERFGHVPEAVANTVKIAERCHVELELGNILIPKFPVPESDLTEQAYLHQLCWQGLAWRYGGIPHEDITHITEEKARELVSQEMVERLDYELGVIARMGYDGYFLIVADFINWGKNRGIIFGPGRGSAAGSIVAYALNITDLDPMKYDLLFERFLNPDRISMPDIDIDIQDTRRGEVIDYVTEKYGQDRVAQIITFGTMAARNAVRDTGRVLGMSYAEVDAIAKLIPPPVQGRHVPLATSIKEDPDLKREYQTNPRAKRLIDLAMQLEGTIRNNGVHAAGVVIAPEDIVNYVPLQRAQKGGIVTQYEMNAIQDDIGLLKMDFLGLSNLTIINNTLRIIKKVFGRTIDLGSLPLDDPKTFELFCKGDTTGVFQLESAGMKRYLRELRPTSFDDIVAMVALYRPGPMQFIDDFIARKNGRKEVVYDHPGMEAALANTYGVLLYQEQFMQISKDMCGFTGGQADTLRKAIGKKQRDTMAKMKKDFIAGMMEHSEVTKDFAETFWAQLEAFADYCFNKSHSACYALIAYQTAYLKAHYPSAFMAALMTSDFGDNERIAKEISECLALGIQVLPPDVNESFLEFAVVPDTGAIRFGLAAVKNIGTAPIEAILAARAEGGRFTSVEDFAKRVSARDCNKKVWESLIRSGAMDSLGERTTLLHNLDVVVGYAAKAQKNALSGQIDLFGSLGEDDNLPALRLLPPADPASAREQLSWEKELLGLYLSHHPLDDYQAYLGDTTTPLIRITSEADGKMARIGGMVIGVRRILTKSNQAMAFVQIEDKTGQLELIVFPKVFEKSPHLWEPDQIITVQGKVTARDRDGKLTSEAKILADGAKLIDYDTAKNHKPASRPAAALPKAAVKTVTSGTGQALQLSITDVDDQQLLVRVREVLGQARGDAEVYLLLGREHKKLRLPFRVEINEQLIQQLAELIGPEAVARI